MTSPELGCRAYSALTNMANASTPASYQLSPIGVAHPTGLQHGVDGASVSFGARITIVTFWRVISITL